MPNTATPTPTGDRLLTFTAIYVWLTYGRPTMPAFLRDFAKLRDHPEFVDSFGNRLSKRSFLKGEFRGRKIVILLKKGGE